MRLVWTHFAVLEPLFNCAVLIPGIVASQGLFRRRVHVLEDLVLAIEDGDGLGGNLVGVLLACLLANLLFVLDFADEQLLKAWDRCQVAHVSQ